MGSISDKLSYLNDTKLAIGRAIMAKGVSVSDSDTFASYADKIRQIRSDNFGSKTIIKNGTYAASSDGLDGYNSVKVTVKTKPFGYYGMTGSFNVETGVNFNTHIKSLGTVTQIIFTHTIPSAYSGSIDVSNAQDKSIMAYYSGGIVYVYRESGFFSFNSDSRAMFDVLPYLTNIRFYDVDTKNVTDMSSMFGHDSGLTSLNLGLFDTDNVTDMTTMFINCTGLTTLYLTQFHTSKVVAMPLMFQGCTNLKTIYVSNYWNTGSVTSGDHMFFKCPALVGGSGTAYDVSHIDYTYAIVDGGTSSPGYLTLHD